MKTKLILSVIALTVTASMLTGCSSGGSFFTGGSVPPGRSTIIGQVVAATGSHAPIADAIVTITTMPPNSGLLTYRVYTNSSGNFEVDGLPTGVVNSNVTVSVTSNSGAFQPQTIDFLLANQRGTNVIMALPPVGYNLQQVAKVVVTPNNNASPGGALYTAETLDANGNVLPILPSIVLDGGIGQLASSNAFTVSNEPNQSGGVYTINSITVEVVNGATVPVTDTITP